MPTDDEKLIRQLKARGLWTEADERGQAERASGYTGWLGPDGRRSTAENTPPDLWQAMQSYTAANRRS